MDHTQTQHDAAYNADPNMDQYQIEERARAELIACDTTFRDYMRNVPGDQRDDAAQLIAASFQLGERTGRQQCSFWTLQGRILADYTAWRIDQEGL
jgi:hypothetical protein